MAFCSAWGLIQSPVGKGAGRKNPRYGLAPDIPAKLGTKACAAFITAGCSHQEDHPAELHVCVFFLATVNSVPTPKCFAAGSNMHVHKTGGGGGDVVCQTHLPLDNDSERIMNMDNDTGVIPSYVNSGLAPMRQACSPTHDLQGLTPHHEGHTLAGSSGPHPSP